MARLSFIGKSTQFACYKASWDSYNVKYYCQGDAESFSFIGVYLTQYKQNLADQNKTYRCVELRFGYLDQQQRSCGFSLLASEEDPGFWLMSVTRGTNLRRSQRDVAIFMSDSAANVYPHLYQDKVPFSEMIAELRALINHNLIYELIMRLFHINQQVDTEAAAFLNDQLSNATFADPRFLQLKFMNWRLNEGALQLAKTGFSTDGTVLSNLARALNTRGQRFFDKANSEAVKTINESSYYEKCHNLLLNAQSQLTHIDALQKCIVNALLFCLTLGAGYLVVALYLGRFMVYDPKTEAEATLFQACQGLSTIPC